MIKAADNYVYGSTAPELKPELKYDVYEENPVLKAKKKQKSYYKVKLRLAGYVLFIFVMCLVVAYRYALITEINYNIEKATREYNYIKNKNVLLKVEMEKELDLNKIKQIAEEKLGMHKPNKYQIVYVNVPKNDFSKVESTYEESGIRSNILTILADKFTQFARLLE